MRKQFLVNLTVTAVLLLFSYLPAADAGPKADGGRLRRSYGANEWHMKRFIAEYVSLEKKFAADPKNPDYAKRVKALKMQIDLLSRENEWILDALDEAEQ